MPIYEYGCDKCGHEFEAEQRITDEPLKTCPTCRSRKVRRLISRTSFVLKGSGWYSDLYSSSKGKSESSGEDSGASGPEKSEKSDKSDTSDGKGGEKKSASGESKPAGGKQGPAKKGKAKDAA